jgi:hypothetical protein
MDTQLQDQQSQIYFVNYIDGMKNFYSIDKISYTKKKENNYFFNYILNSLLTSTYIETFS